MTALKERKAIKTVGFGHALEHEAHHFVVAVPRGQAAEVLVYEVFERDLVGPHLNAANLRCKLDRNRWVKVVDALEEDLNRRLRAAKMKPSRFKAGDNPVARLLGKELVLLAWAIEDADPGLVHQAIQNWRGLAPEERWWLYTMTAAQSAHYAKRNVGWRKAVRFALTENPVAAPSTTTTAEYRRRLKPPRRPETQAALFDALAEDGAAFEGDGIWNET